MSPLFNDPRLIVHIGDGFNFLAENTSTYDVIVIDSAERVGLAAPFQKPQFELLYGALVPGGHIPTQAECLWRHLPLIEGLVATTKTIFPAIEYASTATPTYLSGQIGFCSKERGRNLKEPLRTVDPTRFYNDQVHRAAFVLPECGRSLLEDGVDILPSIGVHPRSRSSLRKISFSSALVSSQGVPQSTSLAIHPFISLLPAALSNPRKTSPSACPTQSPSRSASATPPH